MASIHSDAVAGISILPDHRIALQRVIVVKDADCELGSLQQIVTLMPGDDLSAYDDRIKAVAAAVWTPAVLADAAAARAVAGATRLAQFDAAIADLQTQCETARTAGQAGIAAALTAQIAALQTARDRGAESSV